LFAQIGDVRTEAATDARVKLYQLGVAVPVGLGRVLGSYGEARASAPVSSARKTLSLGYDYNLSKSTDIYGVVMNERATGLSAGNSVAGGLRLRF